ncbi:MBL fold metallo-hydrolase [Echinicola vietnamensis]|uniref:Putative exonuclease of the beta-lactamase fold involved in RNA processing n=1 Tax=Echinicola vietnamensis (strain DSM 17526 / LMG 23754 / KMM 6221) TaxID=926556 RepID=L0G379_ECHVK|nr:MBL fold metallo-hydrolase [Echinicola vietnamensis]AGA80679.1 putative exonuclease of the beta-lactamase fold involved in RNA processing [Echinicola vietnamensis DSM 17526]
MRINRKEILRLSGLLGISLSIPALSFVASGKTLKTGGFYADLEQLRKLSHAIPGDLPDKINVTKVADTIRPASVVVSGESADKKMTLARTVYQLVFPNGSILLDSGMDLETHRTFGKTEEPYYPENFERVKKALDKANLIILTHYHADHSGGIIRSDRFDELAPKVWTSRETAELLINKPHKTTVKISREKVERFFITDFGNYYPIAPGVVVFKAPGHTTDSKMLYIKLANGKEFIHSVDSGWSMENIIEEKMKNASWVHENQEQLLAQYKWLNNIINTEKNITVLCTHDNEQYNDFIEKNILGNGLEV